MRFMNRNRETGGRRFHPLRRQIAALFIGLILLSICLITAVNGLFLESYYISKKTETLQNAVKGLEKLNIIENADGTWTAEIPDSMYKASSEKNLSWTVITWDGQEVASFGSNDDMLENRLIGYAYDLDQNKGRQKILEKTDTYVIQQVSDRFAEMDYVESWGNIDGRFYFLIRSPLESIRESVSISNSFYLYVGAAILLISGLAIWVITKRITKPISELTVLSRKMSDLDFDAKYESRAGNEIDELGENFNRMSAQLEKTISELKSANNELQKDIESKIKIDQMRREFLNNVSHELKTPLAIILTNTELLQSSSFSREKKEHFLDNIRTMAGQMQKLVEEMLELSRIDSGSVQTRMEKLNLSSLTEESLYPFEPLYFESGRQLESEIAPGIQVNGNASQLRQLLEILLDNGLKYSSAASSVSVRLQKVRHSCLLQVASCGEALSEEERKRIFQRFYRTDSSRSRNGSYGLGLSIAGKIVEKHRGKLWAESRDGVNTFYVRLNCLR